MIRHVLTAVCRSPARAAALLISLVIGEGVACAQTIVDDFNPGADLPVFAMAVQADGKILVGGYFTKLGGGGTGTTTRNHLGRLNPDGSVDSTFDPGADDEIHAIIVQPDGKILVAGSFQHLGGGGTGTTARRGLGRLNPDGSLDTTFNPVDAMVVWTLALQPDGKILVAWSNRLSRLNADGSLDSSFNAPTDFWVRTAFVQADGKIVISTNRYVGNPARVARLNTNGSLDAGFAPVRGDLLGLQPDGKILIRDGLRLARLNPDGSLDTSFESATDGGVAGGVTALAVQPDGKILIGGSFETVFAGGEATPRSNIARLNADGSVDPGFNPGANPDPIYGFVPQPDTILVCGSFFGLGGGGSGTTERRFIGRLKDPGDRLIVGLGPQGGRGWMGARGGPERHFDAGPWLQLPWPAYNGTDGGLRPAAGDIDGDGLDEIVVGLGPGGAGWLAVFDDGWHGYAFIKWIRVDWPDYNAANGEVWPAVGDLDGDARAEIVAGLGPGGAGWFEIFDDAAAGFAHLAFRQVSWSDYNEQGAGSTHPAVANLDGVGAGEIVLGLGSNSSGFLEIVGGAASDYSHVSWIQIGWPAYREANGTTFPAAGDLDGDRRAEIVVGLGSTGAGWLEVFDDATTGIERAGWLRTSWTAYNTSSSGETHPAVGNLDGDTLDEIVIGLDSYVGEGGWLEVLDDGAGGYRRLGWQNLGWANFRAAGGATFPAIGRF